MRDRWIRIAVVVAALGLTGGCQSCGLDFDIADLNPFNSCTTCETPAPAPCDPPPQDPCAPTPVATPVAQPAGARPPDANPGEVWCYVRVPAVTETVSEQVCVQPEGCRQEWVPPVTKQVTENVCVQPESTRQINIPPEYKQVPETVCVAPGKTEWRKVDCEAKNLKPQEQIGECWTLVDVPPQYQTTMKQVCVNPGGCRTEVIPAKFEQQTKTVTVTPGYYKQIKVPAVYETQTREVVVCGPRWEWRRTQECEVPEAAGTAPVNLPVDLPPADTATGGPDGNMLPPAGAPGDAPPAGELPPLDPMAPIK